MLNLSGLWGGSRDPRHWIDRVASTKEQLKAKKSLHMIHGVDVARAILAVYHQIKQASGQRYVRPPSLLFVSSCSTNVKLQQILTDLMVYDWWELILGFAGEEEEASAVAESRVDKQIKWIGELMRESSTLALPRSKEELGRCYDCIEFWTSYNLMPIRSRV